MCSKQVSDAIFNIVINMIAENVEAFDAMSVFKKMPTSITTNHKEVNIELITQYHEGKFPRMIICVSRPVPNSDPVIMHRVYVNCNVRIKATEGLKADQRDQAIRDTLVGIMVTEDLSVTEAARRMMEAILMGGYNN
jgi:hypothetical protein